MAKNIEMTTLTSSGSYETLYPKTLSENIIISDSVSDELGLDSGANMNDALSKVQNGKADIDIGGLYMTLDGNFSNENYLQCDGSVVDSTQYPLASSFFSESVSNNPETAYFSTQYSPTNILSYTNGYYITATQGRYITAFYSNDLKSDVSTSKSIYYQGGFQYYIGQIEYFKNKYIGLAKRTDASSTFWLTSSTLDNSNYWTNTYVETGNSYSHYCMYNNNGVLEIAITVSSILWYRMTDSTVPTTKTTSLTLADAGNKIMKMYRWKNKLICISETNQVTIKDDSNNFSFITLSSGLSQGQDIKEITINNENYICLLYKTGYAYSKDLQNWEYHLFSEDSFDGSFINGCIYNNKIYFTYYKVSGSACQSYLRIYSNIKDNKYSDSPINLNGDYNEASDFILEYDNQLYVANLSKSPKTLTPLQYIVPQIGDSYYCYMKVK